MKKMKKKKAARSDGIKKQAWISAPENHQKQIRKLLNKGWMEKQFPNRWRFGIVKPIKKGGDEKKVEKYRGITLMGQLYKLYTALLLDILEEGIEEKNIPDIQTGFRKGRSTVVNLYILNYVIERRERQGVLNVC